jgi:DNA-binding transcriptional LysR family regulator
MIDEMSGDFLQWLRGFYYVTITKSVTQAAALMGREQPSITHHIQCIEKELDVTLFDRSTGKMKLTSEGQILFEKVVSLFEIVKDIKSGFDKERMECRGKIVIVAAYPVIDTFLAPYIINFINTHPHVLFHAEGGSIERVIEILDSAQADIGIADIESFLPRHSIPKNISCFNLFETGEILIVPKKSSFLIGNIPSLDKISKLPLIIFSRTGTVPSYYERIFTEKGLKPNIIMTCNNYLTIKNYVSMGLGITILGGYSITNEDKKRFAIFPMDKFFPKRKYSLLIRKGKYLSPATKAFIMTLKQNIRHLDTKKKRLRAMKGAKMTEE